ncbi:hypothetical protein V6N12_068609 [Hibiscus sabdariffa]|uniref:Uncharacterized protein n=1 Tax=Hibiscus sabdariffa TaxID=183260 RepID=A0ABR2FQF3_9ROSI
MIFLASHLRPGYDIIFFISNLTRRLRIVGTVVSLFSAGCCGRIDGSPAMLPQSWLKPPPGWIKANVDASVSLADGKAAIGLAAFGRSSSSNGLSLPFPPDDLALLIENEKDRSAYDPVILLDWYVAANVACFNLHSDPGG